MRVWPDFTLAPSPLIRVVAISSPVGLVGVGEVEAGDDTVLLDEGGRPPGGLLVLALRAVERRPGTVSERSRMSTTARTESLLPMPMLGLPASP